MFCLNECVAQETQAAGERIKFSIFSELLTLKAVFPMFWQKKDILPFLTVHLNWIFIYFKPDLFITQRA